MTNAKAKLAGLALIASLCAVFTLGLTAPAWAGWDKGFAAYDRGDYATALREWRPHAEQGVAEAQVFLRITPRRCGGIARPPSKGTPEPNTVSATRTDTA